MRNTCKSESTRTPPRDLIAAFGAFFVTLALHTHATEISTNPGIRTLLFGSPALGILALAIGVGHFLRRTDEYFQRMIVSSLAFSGGATIVFSLGWAFLSDAGAPHLPIEAAGLVALLAWGMAAIWFKWQTNRERVCQTLKWIGASFTVSVILAGCYVILFGLAGWQWSWFTAMLVCEAGFGIGLVGLLLAKKIPC